MCYMEIFLDMELENFVVFVSDLIPIELEYRWEHLDLIEVECSDIKKY